MSEDQRILEAVKTVLLSDEFIEAFAKRFYEMPLPFEVTEPRYVSPDLLTVTTTLEKE